MHLANKHMLNHQRTALTLLFPPIFSKTPQFFRGHPPASSWLPFPLSQPKPALLSTVIYLMLWTLSWCQEEGHPGTSSPSKSAWPLRRKWKLLNYVWVFAIPWTIQSMEFSRPGYWSGLTYTLCQGIFPTQGSNLGLLHCRWILYQLSHQGSPRILEWVAYPFPVDLPYPGIEPGSPALQADSLPTELKEEGFSGKWGEG